MKIFFRLPRAKHICVYALLAGTCLIAANGCSGTKNESVNAPVDPQAAAVAANEATATDGQNASARAAAEARGKAAVEAKGGENAAQQ